MSQDHHDDRNDRVPADRDGLVDDLQRHEVVFEMAERFEHPEDRLEWLFMSWVWEAGYDTWEDGLRALAQALQGLERIGLIERRAIRLPGLPTRHGFALTEEGRQTLAVLAGGAPRSG
jgi:hypothetical protein